MYMHVYTCICMYTHVSRGGSRRATLRASFCRLAWKSIPHQHENLVLPVKVGDARFPILVDIGGLCWLVPRLILFASSSSSSRSTETTDCVGREGLARFFGSISISESKPDFLRWGLDARKVSEHGETNLSSGQA
jgi:hypothetical protein